MSQFESRDYFAVLGLSRSATDADVKKAYRKLAVQWHPDKNRENPKAEEYFKRIAEAYEVLSDPEKRRQYERSSTRGGGEDDAFSGFAFHSGGFSSRHARDIFEAFFGGGHDPFENPFFRDAGRDPFDTPFFRGAGVSGLAGRRQPAMDPFDDFDDAFGFGFGFPSVGRGGSPFRHSSRGMNGSVMAGNSRSFSSQTVSSSTSTDRRGRVVTTTTTTTMTPDGRAETVTETFRDGALLSSSSSNSRLAGAGRMQLDHRGARRLS
jgi:DnaJ homolog subfamily B member 6